ncbi:MAG: GNAT family N-acetyltransferase [Bacteroidota bacterium]
MTIRPYRSTDRAGILEMLRLNTPQYFHPSEEEDLVAYLRDEAENYFVVEEDGQVLGCGGFNHFRTDALVRIAWDIVHPHHHGKGIGKQLTQFRLEQIKKDPSVRRIVVRTSQLVFPFYEKMGSQLEKVDKDFWAEGFDLYQMEMRVGD